MHPPMTQLKRLNASRNGNGKVYRHESFNKKRYLVVATQNRKDVFFQWIIDHAYNGTMLCYATKKWFLGKEITTERFFDHVSIPKIIQSFEPFPFSGCNFVETCRRPGSLQANIGTLCQKSDPDLISTPQISRAEANQLTPLWQLRSFCRKGFVRSSLQNNLWIWVKNRSIYTVDQYNWHDTWSSEMYLPRVLSKNNNHFYPFLLFVLSS